MRQAKSPIPNPLHPQGSLTEVAGVKVGHATDLEAITGCSVLFFPEGSVGGVSIRGGAPTTRGCDSLHAGRLVDRIDAVVLTGGSAFGLDSVGGVMAFLEERSVGFDVAVTRVPIVAAAVLFDLAVGDWHRRPDREMGYRACVVANGGPPAQGSVGAGTGATVGKLLGVRNATKGGIGTSALSAPGGLVVGAMFAVNAFGDVVSPWEGRIVAGLRDAESGDFLDTMSAMREGRRSVGYKDQGTVIGVVATNARLSKPEVERVASVAHDGIALVISPPHTLVDGDTVFAVATQQVEAEADLVTGLAVQATAQAILSGVLNATSLGGIPACRDL